MTEQWQELKETITEMRDNDGTGTQQEVCKFLTNYMEILEKQMQQPCDDCISRKTALEIIEKEEFKGDAIYGIERLLSVTSPPKIGRWIRQTDDYHDYYECEQCGIAVGIDDIRNFCPNCGARMENAGREWEE